MWIKCKDQNGRTVLVNLDNIVRMVPSSRGMRLFPIIGDKDILVSDTLDEIDEAMRVARHDR